MAALPNPALLQRSFFRQGSCGVTKFREVKIPHVVDEALALPTLYLHFLHDDFRMQENNEIDPLLRAGNDMSEVVVQLPSKYTSDEFAAQCGQCRDAVKVVTEALCDHGQLLVNNSRKVSSQTLFFALKTARPKSGISLDNKAFGIPADADQYLFVNNHSSVVYFEEEVKQAFSQCIAELPECGSADAARFATFLKVFYEGGFGYNKKVPMGRGFLPVNVGTAAMSVVPSFPGQVGIATGYPYQLPSRFLPFTETVPISIDAIREMSERHGRYGLAFTRSVFVWEGDEWQSSRTLDFCSIMPHGGFFYVPETLEKHRAMGGFVYAFGESKEGLTVAAENN